MRFVENLWIVFARKYGGCRLFSALNRTRLNPIMGYLEKTRVAHVSENFEKARKS